MAYNVGLVGPYDWDGVIQNDFFAAMAIWYADRNPLITRLRNVAVAATQVKAVDDAYRPNSTRLTDANGVINTNTSLTLTESSFLMPGDVLEIDNEQVLVTAVNATANTATVTRGHANTTAASHNANSLVYLVGNTRTGAEVDQDGPIRNFDSTLTYPQTVQHPYQIGGALEAKSSNMAIPLGFASLVGYQRAKASQETLDDLERAAIYGKAVPLSGDTTRPQMRGIRQRITTNLTTNPTSGSAYKPSDFERDFLTGAFSYGGKPDVLVLANNYRVGFQTWGINLQQLLVRDNTLGVDIRAFTSPVLGDVSIIFDPMLRDYHGIALTSAEVYMGWVREPFDKPRGSRGDATEGDVIGEGCVVLNNEAHHAWVEGITGWAKQS